MKLVSIELASKKDTGYIIDVNEVPYVLNIPGLPDGKATTQTRRKPLTSLPNIKSKSIKTDASVAGKPILLFHGSAMKFDSFNRKSIYLSTDPLTALSFINTFGFTSGNAGKDPSLYVCLLKCDNMLTIEKGVKHPALKSWKNPHAGSNDAMAKSLQESGEFDAVRWLNLKDGGTISDVYHTIHSKNITILKRIDIQQLYYDYEDEWPLIKKLFKQYGINSNQLKELGLT